MLPSFTWGHFVSVGRFFSWKRLRSWFFWSRAIILLTASLSFSSCSNVCKQKEEELHSHSINTIKQILYTAKSAFISFCSFTWRDQCKDWKNQMRLKHGFTNISPIYKNNEELTSSLSIKNRVKISSKLQNYAVTQ